LFSFHFLTVLAAGTLLWAGFMIYLLTHVEKFSHYGGSLRTGYVQWASQIFSDHNVTQIEQDIVSSYSNRISEAETILVRYPHVAKVMFVDLFPALQGQVIYMDSDIIVQGIF